jgi:methionyl-tRNA formyltransferase
MRVACVGYRDWAHKIYDELAQITDHAVLIIRSREQYDDRSLVDFKPDLVLFYGWSWMVKPEITKSFDCIMLHPSALPKYRGGSPIQNQIIAGETSSAVTLFIMSEDMDAGDVIAQEEISLEGHLDEIFARITEVGLRLTVDILRNGYSRTPQDHSQATYYKRRKPEESEITPEELTNSSVRYLYNKVRMLEDPYPNAFIRTADGQRLLIKKSEIDQA